MQLAILGAGYVGLVTGASFARLGHQVAIFETDPRRLEPLLRGDAPFHEPGLAELVRQTVRSGALAPHGDAGAALSTSELVLVCVGTPLGPEGAADMTQVIAAGRMIAQHAPDAGVVIRSTLPLGTTRELAGWFMRDSLDAVVTNPEFLRQGTAIRDFVDPTRIVIGTHDGTSTATADLLRVLYSDFDAPILVTDFNSAEMIKNVANAFLATKLSFINEVADLCEAYDADVEQVVNGVGLDPRIGSTYLQPGIGFGGSCLPKELANIVRLGHQRGLATPLMAGAAQTNEARPHRIADRLERILGPVRGCRVALLGLAFKPDTDDVRYSPAIALGEALAGRGATVIGHDEAVRPAATQHLAWLHRAASPSEAIEAADLVVLATEWSAYLQLNWEALSGRVRRPALYDGRNVLDRSALLRAGWRVVSVGRRDRSVEAEVLP